MSYITSENARHGLVTLHVTHTCGHSSSLAYASERAALDDQQQQEQRKCAMCSLAEMIAGWTK